MSNRFGGRVALVTGAASGIGRAVVLRLAGEGASVFAVDVNEGGLDETKSMATGEVVPHTADVSDPAACADAVARCVSAFGRLDVLGNVAGIYIASNFTEMTPEQYRRLMGVNLDGCFFLAQAAVPHLLAAGGNGNIVNIASNAGLQGVPYSVAYAMTKGGVVQLTRSLAVEYLKKPLRVNAIAPAGTRTNISSNSSFPPDVEVELMTRMVGLRGMAEPEDVAAVFAFLASDEARSVTGAIYTVDNGLTAS